jgi:hypothetical protein
MNEHFREALESLDIDLVRRMWAHVMPHLPQPESDEAALISIHMARTSINFMPFRHRAYSHAWLKERAFPSQLPDALRAPAERLYPSVVAAVGIAVHSRTPIALEIRRAMSDAVFDAGVKDSLLTKRAILNARAKARRQLLGIT